MKKYNVKAENWAQAEAFRRMKGDAMELIPAYAAGFRKIIDDFKGAYNGRIPTADDLLWIESERRGRDITK